MLRLLEQFVEDFKIKHFTMEAPFVVKFGDDLIRNAQHQEISQKQFEFVLFARRVLGDYAGRDVNADEKTIRDVSPSSLGNLLVDVVLGYKPGVYISAQDLKDYLYLAPTQNSACAFLWAMSTPSLIKAYDEIGVKSYNFN